MARSLLVASAPCSVRCRRAPRRAAAWRSETRDPAATAGCSTVGSADGGDRSTLGRGPDGRWPTTVRRAPLLVAPTAASIAFAGVAADYGRRGNGSDLLVAARAAARLRAVPGTQLAARDPVFSPDGAHDRLPRPQLCSTQLAPERALRYCSTSIWLRRPRRGGAVAAADSDGATDSAVEADRPSRPMARHSLAERRGCGERPSRRSSIARRRSGRHLAAHRATRCEPVYSPDGSAIALSCARRLADRVEAPRSRSRSRLERPVRRHAPTASPAAARLHLHAGAVARLSRAGTPRASGIAFTQLDRPTRPTSTHSAGSTRSIAQINADGSCSTPTDRARSRGSIAYYGSRLAARRPAARPARSAADRSAEIARDGAGRRWTSTLACAVGLDLDQAGAGGERVGQLGERVEAAVGEVEEGGGLGGVDAARGAEQGLELLAAERLLPGAGSGRCRRRRCR